MGISLQDDVKKSFEKVKDDILNIKRSINRELLAIEEVGGRLQTFVAKEEFYSFVKRLGERLDKMDANLELFLGYEDDIKNVDVKIKGVNKKISRQEDLGSEIKEVRKLRGKVATLEGSIVNAQKFNEDMGKVLSDIASVRRSMLTSKSLDNVKAGMEKAEKRLESIERKIPSKDDVAASLGAIDELRKNVNKTSSDLKADIESVKSASVEKEVFEKKVRELKKDNASIKDILERSVSEVDMSDYATRKELGKRLETVKDLNNEVDALASSTSDIGDRLESLRKEAASIEDIERIGSDVKGIAKSLDSLKAAIEKTSDATQKRFENELSKVKSDFDDKLKKAVKEKPSGKEGILAKVSRGFSDFFKEDDVPSKKAKTSPSVSDILKEEEKKSPKKGKGVRNMLISSAALIIVLLVIFFALPLVTGPEEAQDGVTAPEEGADEAADVILEEIVGEELPVVEEDVVDAPQEEPVKEEAETEAVVEETTSPAEAETEPEVVDEEVTEEDVVDAAPEEIAEKVDEEVAAPAAIGTQEYCTENYECKELEDGKYGFDCYLDEDSECRCFVTDAEGCGIVVEETGKTEKELKESGGSGKTGYLVAATIVFAVFILVYLSNLRNKKGGKRKPKKKEESEEEGVDLEDFFQKK